MRLTPDQFEIVTLAALNAMVEPLCRARGSHTQVEGVMETTASILVALARDAFGVELTLDDALAALDIKRQVFDYMDLIQQPGDEHTPEPPAPDFKTNAEAFAWKVAGVSNATGNPGPIMRGIPDGIDLSSTLATRVADCYYIAKYADELHGAIGGQCLQRANVGYAERMAELAARVSSYVVVEVAKKVADPRPAA